MPFSFFQARSLTPRVLLAALSALLWLGLASPVHGLPRVKWEAGSIGEAFHPENMRGSNPIYTGTSTIATGRAGISRQLLETLTAVRSGNYRFAVPVIDAPGRGLHLNLTLHYNAKLWTQRGEIILFDVDGDWPAPGWSLGFGRIVAGTLFDADGTRHPGREVQADTLTRVYETTDGTFVDYVIHLDSNGRNPVGALARFPDGRVIEYGAVGASAAGPSVLHAVKITDRNGNFIDIRYRNNQGPLISEVIDTVERRFTFQYDQQERLASITGPGLNGLPRTLMLFRYRQASIPDYLRTICRPRCTGPRLNVSKVQLIEAILRPGSRTGYWFGAADSISEYGMIRRISEHRLMRTAAVSPTSPVSILPGVMTREVLVNYPARIPSPRDPAPLPRYTVVTESWVGMDTLPAETRHSILPELGVTYPDGRRDVTRVNAQGLVAQVETYDPSGALLGTSRLTWEAGAVGAPRVRRSEAVDAAGRPTVVEYEYGPRHNLVTAERFLDFSGQVARVRRTEYADDPALLARHLLRLAKTVELYGSANYPYSRAELEYDTEPLATMTGIPRQSVHFQPPPLTPPMEPRITLPGFSVVPGRGNLSRIRTYADAMRRTGEITETLHHDMTGNLVAILRPGGQATRFAYSGLTQYAFPDQASVGAADPASPVRLTESYGYDLSTGLRTSVTDANGQPTGLRYRPDDLRLDRIERATGALARFAYDDANLATQVETVAGAVVHTTRRTIRNGLGLLRREEQLGEGGRLEIVETRFDVLGRPTKRSRPRVDGAAAHWHELGYDVLGRLTHTRAPDGSRTRWIYDDPQKPAVAFSTLGLTVRRIDPWGREHWERYDVFDQLAEVVEPPADGRPLMGPDAMRTLYAYSPRGELQSIVQGDIRPGRTLNQVRTLAYDSLGRLIGLQLPERLATLDPFGNVGPVAPNRRSDFFEYDARSNLVAHTDARGVRTVFDYGSDPLDRLQTVRYDLSRAADPRSAIVPVPSITYQYEPAGDQTRVRMVRVEGRATEQFEYHPDGRPKSRTVTLDSWSGAPLRLDYLQDEFGRRQGLVYPPQYGWTGGPLPGPRKFTWQRYGPGSRLSVLEYRRGPVDASTREWLSEFHHDASDQLVDARMRPETATADAHEVHDYDPATGRVVRQRVSRGPDALLDLSYSYGGPGLVSSSDGGFVGLADPSQTGQLTGVTDLLGNVVNHRYRYDFLGRLAAVEARTRRALGDSVNWTQRYRYDPFGNLVGVVGEGPPPHVVCPSPPAPCEVPPGPSLPARNRDGASQLPVDPQTNRITTPGYEYDAAGNLTRGPRATGGWQRYQYDAAGRRVRVAAEAADGTLTDLETYLYGADARPLGRFDGTAWWLAAWDGPRRVAEYRAGSVGDPLSWTGSDLFAGERHLATVVPGATAGTDLVRSIHPVRIGARLRVEPGPSAFTQTLPYGNEVPYAPVPADDATPFAGYARSAASGLDHAAYRAYDRQLGRFLSVDPLGPGSMAPGNPQTHNAYAFALNDPVNLTDPTGLRARVILFDAGCLASHTAEYGMHECAIWSADPGPTVILPLPDTWTSQGNRSGTTGGGPSGTGGGVRGDASTPCSLGMIGPKTGQGGPSFAPSMVGKPVEMHMVSTAYNVLRSDPRTHAFFKLYWGVDPFDEYQNIEWVASLPGADADASPGRMRFDPSSFLNRQSLAAILMHELTHIASYAQFGYGVYKSAHNAGPGGTKAAEELGNRIWHERCPDL